MNSQIKEESISNLLISRKSRRPFNHIKLNKDLIEDRSLSIIKTHKNGQLTEYNKNKLEHKITRDLTPQNNN